MSTKRRLHVCKDEHGNINPNCPHEKELKFNDWVRLKLPASHDGYRAYNVDWSFWHKYDQNMMYCECKMFGKDIAPDQRQMLKMLNNWIKNGIEPGWTWYGTHLIQFEKTCFDDGWCRLNRREVTEQQLMEFLSFKADYALYKVQQ